MFFREVSCDGDLLRLIEYNSELLFEVKRHRELSNTCLSLATVLSLSCVHNCKQTALAHHPKGDPIAVQMPISESANFRRC